MFTERLQNKLVINTKNQELQNILRAFYSSATAPSTQKPQLFEALRPIGEIDVDKAIEMWGTPKQAELNLDNNGVAILISLEENGDQVRFSVSFDTDRCPPDTLLSYVYETYPQTEIKSSWFCDDDGSFSSFTNGSIDEIKSVFDMDITDPSAIPYLIMLESTFDLDIAELLNIISDISPTPLTDDEIEDILNNFSISKT